jgi:formimidoylglutamate deiminase
MLAEAERQTPESVRAGYEAAYGELRRAGYTAVGEFHYLGLDEAFAAVDAAAAAGIEITLLLAAYERGGLPRFRQRSIADYFEQVERLRAEGVRVGVAPHSVRACSANWLVEVGRYAETEGLVLHVHADEQLREIEECLAEHGLRPIELLGRSGCLGPGATVVHATHADDRELDLLAETGTRVCLCPTSESDLGDGFAPVDRVLEREIAICIGSDSNVRIDPLEELRELEGIARRQAGRREVIPVEALLEMGTTSGADALAIDVWPDIEIHVDHPSLAGVLLEQVPAALVSSCGADVLAPTGEAGLRPT